MTSWVLLRATDRMARPWRNGGGITRDVAAAPAGAGPETFDWRLSVAEIVEAGLFSLFPGTDRHLAVLEGALELRFGDEPAGRILSPDSEPIRFQADCMVSGHPIGGPVRVLNLMLRRGVWAGRLSAPGVAGFSTTASTTVIVAREPAMLEVDAATCSLSALDAATLGPGAMVRGPSPLLLMAQVDPLTGSSAARFAALAGECHGGVAARGMTDDSA